MVFSSVIFLFLFLPVVLGCYYLCPDGKRKISGSLRPACCSMRSVDCGMYCFCFFRILQLSGGPVCFRAEGSALRCSGGQSGSFGGFQIPDISGEDGGSAAGRGNCGTFYRSAGGHLVFTFQGLSYVIDVYRNERLKSTRFRDVLLYIALFPQLVAGPIVRYEDVADEIKGRRHTLEQLANGLRRFIIGLSKKLLIADVCGSVVTLIYSAERSVLDSRTAWLAAVCYLIQIYFDFSGYSDMAIGLGLCFGFHFKENFNYPYISASIQEFWRRWHISLSTWFREYLYIPLGGNRKGKAKTYRNKLIVFSARVCGMVPTGRLLSGVCGMASLSLQRTRQKSCSGLESTGKQAKPGGNSAETPIHLAGGTDWFCDFPGRQHGTGLLDDRGDVLGYLCFCPDRAAAGTVPDTSDYVCAAAWPCGQHTGSAASLP